MGNFIKEFKEFIMRGNVLDMAVGVIIGGAFTAIVNSLVDDLLNPIIGLFGSNDLASLSVELGSTGVMLNYGSFISAVINFLIVAFVIFCIVKAINKATSITKKDEPVEEEVAAPTEADLLAEIVDILKAEKADAADAAVAAEAAVAADTAEAAE